MKSHLLSVHLTLGLVWMDVGAFQTENFVMEEMIALMVQTSQSPSAPLRVQQICLFVLMVLNVLVHLGSVME